jgi:hypothetical protein
MNSITSSLGLVGYVQIRIPFECSCSYKTTLHFTMFAHLPKYLKCQFCEHIYEFKVQYDDYNSEMTYRLFEPIDGTRVGGYSTLTV